MQNIESEFHNLLEDVAPSVHTKDEQARIIAEASANFTKMSSRRLAKRNTNPRLVEAQMTDAGFLDITTAGEEDPELFDFENGDNQDPAAFTDKPKHRSDFQSSPSR